jgi:HTH-type transcriptional regulator/antitoxin HipB
VFVQYPIETGRQLTIVLKALRQSRQLTQAELGVRLGVNQKRIARIEAEPGVTSFDQIARMVALMGYRIVLEEIPPADKPLHVADNTPTW